MKYIIYDENQNEMDDKMFDSLEDVIAYYRIQIQKDVVARFGFDNMEKLTKEQINERIGQLTDPCELCGYHIDCLQDAPCTYSPTVYGFPDKIEFSLTPEKFFGLSIIQDFFDLINLDTFQLSFVGTGRIYKFKDGKYTPLRGV